MKNPNSGPTTLSDLQAYQPIFTDVATRAERGRVETKDGRRIFDSELREPYQEAEKYMNDLLERYFAENAKIEFLVATGGVELPDVFIDCETVPESLPIKHTEEMYEADGA